MKISTMFRKGRPVFSLEVFPPKKMGSIDSIYTTLDGLKNMCPDYISVTYGAGGNTADTKTRDIALSIKEKYGLESMAHLTCVSCTKEDVEKILDDYMSCGIENIFALRGDVNPEVLPKDDFKYASELASFIKKKSSFFGVGGACYPEGHSEAESLEVDIENLKKKVEAGAEFLVSQLFFDNDFFYKFREKAGRAGVHVPISAGIMCVTNKKQIERMVTMCGASLPPALAKLMSKYADDPESLTEAGIEYASEQIRGLLANGVDGIHFYTMNNPVVALSVYENIKSFL